jgi:D-tyrosyl-tRNA(Tyr) deacylase
VKAVLQRVRDARVTVDEKLVGSIQDPAQKGACGLLVLLGVQQGDSEEDSLYLARKTAELRIFQDEQGKMNKSVQDVGGSILVVSQFTLIADWRNGRRPGFSRAAKPEDGERLYRHFVKCLKEMALPVETGEFGAHMQVSLVNDGPVTLILDTKELSVS